MIVFLGVPIKSFLPPADLQFFYNPGLRQDFQVSVNRRQTDSRQFFFNALVQLVCSGMGFSLVQLVENDLTLMGHTQVSIHDFPFEKFY